LKARPASNGHEWNISRAGGAPRGCQWGRGTCQGAKPLAEEFINAAGGGSKHY